MQDLAFPIAVELYEHWGKEGTVRTLVRAIAIGLGIIDPPESPVTHSTPPEEIATMIVNPKGFGGGSFPIEALPEWMKLSLAKLNL